MNRRSSVRCSRPASGLGLQTSVSGSGKPEARCLRPEAGFGSLSMRHCLATLGAACALVASSCFGPNIQDGHVECAASDDDCPTGFQCRACDHRCWRNPNLACETDGGEADAPEGDASVNDAPVSDAPVSDAPV